MDHTAHMGSVHAGHGEALTDEAGHQMTMGGGGMMMMQMTFFFGTKGKILFDSWNPKTTGEFVGACVAWFAIALFYEMLKALRQYIYNETRQIQCCPHQHGVDISGSADSHTPMSKRWFNALISPGHVIDTVMYGVQFVIAYLLMLAVMTYNAWLFIAIGLGALVGHFLFGWMTRNGGNNEGHCF